MFNQRAAIATEPVHYKGTGAAVAAVLSGEVDYTVASISTARGPLQAGKLRAIAITTMEAPPAAPRVPALATVVPGFDAFSFIGLHAPAKTPPGILRKIHADVTRTIHTSEIENRLAELGLQVATNSSDQFRNFLAIQIAHWGNVIREANIQAQ
jgi:tripartite-type tricarboxylate transporter receptor subunit TctC